MTSFYVIIHTFSCSIRGFYFLSDGLWLVAVLETAGPQAENFCKALVGIFLLTKIILQFACRQNSNTSKLCPASSYLTCQYLFSDLNC